MTTDLKILKKILELRDKGKTYKEIHTSLHCARSTVAFAIRNKDMILKSIEPKSKPKPFRYLIYVKAEPNLNSYIHFRRKLIDRLPTSNTIAPIMYDRNSVNYIKGKYTYTYNQFLDKCLRYPYYYIINKDLNYFSDGYGYIVGWYPLIPKDYSIEMKLEIAKVWNKTECLFQVSRKEAILMTLAYNKAGINDIGIIKWQEKNIDSIDLTKYNEVD